MSIKYKLCISYLVLFLMPLFVIIAFTKIWVTSIGFSNIGFWLLAASVVFIIILNITLAFFMLKSILTPLNLLMKVVRAVKEGNLDYNVTYETKDEFGAVIKEFDEMRIRLKETLNKNIHYEEEKKDLTASIVHDLKTPITSILGYIEGILDNVADTWEKKENYLRIVYDKTKQINKMVNDLFLISKLDLEQIEFTVQTIQIVPFLKDYVEELKYEFEEKNIEISLDINSNECQDYQEYFVTIDTSEMNRILQNIIQNSIKYKSHTPLKINFILYKNKQRVILKIVDNGIGLGKDEEKKIFDRFYRSDNARKIEDGSGLGLAISKQLIESFGGKIWARQNEEQGLSIYISFPVLKQRER